MTQDEIIRMAREAGVSIRGYYDETGSTPQELERFAALVAAHEREKQAEQEPVLHVGDSSFEDWYQAHPKASCGDKQLARDAYAAGMGDPLVAPVKQEPVAEVVSEHTHGEYESIKKLVDYRLPCRTKLYAAPQPMKQEPVAWMDRKGHTISAKRLNEIKELGDGTIAASFYIPLYNKPTITKYTPEVAWLIETSKGERTLDFDLDGWSYRHATPLYAVPVRTKDLADDEIHKAFYSKNTGLINGIRAVIAADREKNK